MGNNDKASKPIFLHTQFRSAGTYLWSDILKHDQCTGYYEPFHESLLVPCEATVLESAAESRQDRGHGFLEAGYFNTYLRQPGGSVTFLEPTHCYAESIVAPESANPGLHAYISNLLAQAPARPVFKFCRSLFRMGWIVRNFEGVHIGILRQPRAQWRSYQSFPDRYFDGINLMLAGCCGGLPPIKAANDILHVPFFSLGTPRKDLDFYSHIARRCPPETMYFIFYYTWLASVAEMLAYANLVLDSGMISAKPDGRSIAIRSLADLGITVGLEDFNLPGNENLPLSPDILDRIEEDAACLLAGDSWTKDRLKSIEAGLATSAGTLHPDTVRRMKRLFDAPVADRPALSFSPPSMMQIAANCWQDLHRDLIAAGTHIEVVQKANADLEKRLADSILIPHKLRIFLTRLGFFRR